MRRTFSLRLRLTGIILFPLLGVSVAAGLWQLNNARNTASEVFDRSLLSAALSVTSDVSASGGDALSVRTRKILADTSGGQVFYHVYAPDGVIVAGYATPPVGIPKLPDGNDGRVYFNGEYLGRQVRGLRMLTRTEIDGFSGLFTTTVWQDINVRSSFVNDLVLRSFLVIAGLILSLALIVWFGVRFGLQPLNSIQQAIDLRSTDELKPIRRAVPEEVEGIVVTLNRLFAQVSQAMTAQNNFISNAAHQLRNPIAGILALAESVLSTDDPKEARNRAQDLVKAAKDARDLAQQMLTYERARMASPASSISEFSLVELIQQIVAEFEVGAQAEVSFRLTNPEEPILMRGDQTLIGEAIVNLLDNAARHGGPGLSHIEIVVENRDQQAVVTLSDNGVGIPVNNIEQVLERFGQISSSGGSGLGLPIVAAVAESHGGDLELEPQHPGLKVSFSISKHAKNP